MIGRLIFSFLPFKVPEDWDAAVAEVLAIWADLYGEAA